MRILFNLFSLITSLKDVRILAITLGLLSVQGCHFDKDSNAPNYAADPHCANIVQQMHANYDTANQPSKRITMIQQAQLLREYQTYNCDDVPDS